MFINLTLDSGDTITPKQLTTPLPFITSPKVGMSAKPVQVVVGDDLSGKIAIPLLGSLTPIESLRWAEFFSKLDAANTSLFFTKLEGAAIMLNRLYKEELIGREHVLGSISDSVLVDQLYELFVNEKRRWVDELGAVIPYPTSDTQPTTESS